MELLSILFKTIVEEGVLGPRSLGLIVISLLIVIYKYVLRPMQKSIKELPSLKQINSTRVEMRAVDNLRMDDLKDKLEKILLNMEELELIDNGVSKDMQVLRNDIEGVKQMLNQIQGHFMFSGRSSGFGNKELKDILKSTNGFPVNEYINLGFFNFL